MSINERLLTCFTTRRMKPQSTLLVWRYCAELPPILPECPDKASIDKGSSG